MKNLSLMMVGVLLFSCSKINKFESKADAMEKTSKSLTESTTKAKELTETKYVQTRALETAESRSRNFKAMKEVHGMGEKILSAAAYFKSFEFQLWTNTPTFDDEQAKNTMLVSAATEFTRAMSDLYGKLSKRDKKRMSPMKAGILNQDEMDFYAIAATLRMNNEYQEELAKEKKTSKISFYGMIKRALIHDFNGQRLEAHEEVLMNGINKEIMVELLKARVDILAALALKNLTDKRKMSPLQKLGGILFNATGGFLGAISLPVIYDQSNDATKKFTISWLESAVKTRQLLQELSIEKNLEKTVKSAFEQIDLRKSNDENAFIGDEKREEISILINKLL